MSNNIYIALYISSHGFGHMTRCLAVVDYILKNKDRVRIVTDDLSFGPREDWIDKAHTSLAKRKIRDFNKK